MNGSAWHFRRFIIMIEDAKVKATAKIIYYYATGLCRHFFHWQFNSIKFHHFLGIQMKCKSQPGDAVVDYEWKDFLLCIVLVHISMIHVTEKLKQYGIRYKMVKVFHIFHEFTASNSWCGYYDYHLFLLKLPWKIYWCESQRVTFMRSFFNSGLKRGNRQQYFWNVL